MNNGRHRLNGQKFAFAALATGLWAAGTLLYSFAIERKWLELFELSLDLPTLDPAFDGYRIVQISDFHFETWITPEYVERIIETVNQQDADLIVFTGDYVHRDVDPVETQLQTMLRRLQARDGVVGILGNHDHWKDGAAVRRVVTAGGVVDLNNTCHTIERDGAALHIAGIDSVIENKARLDFVLDQLPSDGAAILLAHEPDFAHVAAATGRFDLQLSGHSHGGQIRVPILKQLALPKLSETYSNGLYNIGNNLLLYVNRGLGVSEIPFRLNCRPEITVLTLHPTDQAPRYLRDAVEIEARQIIFR